MNYLKSFIYSVLFLFIALASMLAFLLTTTPGLYTTITLANLFLPGKIEVHHAAGRLINHFAFTELVYEQKDLRIQLARGKIHWHLPSLFNHQLTIMDFSADKLIVDIKSATNVTKSSIELATRKLQLPFSLQISNLTIREVQLQYIGLTQYFNNLKLQAAFNNERWIIKHFSAHVGSLGLSLQANGQSYAPYALTSTLQFMPLARGPGLQGTIKLGGDLGLYHWQGQLNGPAHGDLHGTLKNCFELYTHANWYNAKWPMQNSTVLQSSAGDITINGNLQDMLVKAHSNIEAPVTADWQMTGRIKNQQADIKSIIHLPQGSLQTTIVANATFCSAQDAKLALTINSGTYQLPEGSPIPTLPFKGGKLLVNLTPESLQASGAITLDQQKTFDLSLRIPQFRLDEVAKTSQHIDGKLSLHIDSFDFLHGISEAVDHFQGKLDVNLIAKGALIKPIVTGELLLTNGSLTLPKSGLIYTPITASLHSSNNHWLAEGSMSSGGQSLILKGQGDFSPKMSGQLTLQGENFPAIKTAEYSINLSPELSFKFNPKSFDIGGNILVPTAQLKPLSFSNTVNLSEDVVFVKKDTAATNPFNITTNVDVKMGQNVVLDVKGLYGYLDGSFHLRQLPHQSLNAIGELTIRDGKYRAYGQDLIVDQGQLLFTGGPIDNPSINLRAIRKFNTTTSSFSGSNQLFDFNSTNLDTVDFGNKTTVGIEINGRLNAHKITLFSIPASLSQSDILSLLILGKPANQANKSGGQLLMAAISSMNLDTGTKGLQLLEQLKQTLGVDFNVQNNTLYNQKTNQVSDNTAVVVSKSLTKRLYLSYNIGLLQKDSNVLTLKYLLNKFFSIQVNTSDSGSGLDFLYTQGKD